MEKKYILSNDEIKELTDIKGSCIASDQITVMGKKVGFMYREEPSNEIDSGWRFFSGDEDEEYTDNPNNFEVYSINTICNYDKDIIPYLNKPVGTELEKINKEYKEVTK